jgi:pimeloyl-ACP methyl ester carboxylesterase
MVGEDKVSFANSRGQTLVGVLHYAEPQKASGGAILCHGMESDKESEKLVFLSRELARTGIPTLRFDFAYAGESSGSFEEITYSGGVEDLKAAYCFLLGRQARKIAILGSSMGGTVALLFAAQEPTVAALVTVAAPIHPKKITEKLLTPEQMCQWREQGYTYYHGQRINVSLLDDLERIDILKSASRIACPVLIIHGERDETVPVEEAYELHDQLSDSKKLAILKGADHRLSDPSLMKHVVVESMNWISQNVR